MAAIRERARSARRPDPHPKHRTYQVGRLDWRAPVCSRTVRPVSVLLTQCGATHEPAEGNGRFPRLAGWYPACSSDKRAAFPRCPHPAHSGHSSTGREMRLPESVSLSANPRFPAGSFSFLPLGPSGLSQGWEYHHVDISRALPAVRVFHRSERDVATPATRARSHARRADDD